MRRSQYARNVLHAYSVLIVLMVGCRTMAPVTRATARVSEPVPGDSIVLERTLCFGFCPAYRVRIARDGHVHFESRTPRDSGRIEQARVAPEAVLTLLAQADRLELDTLPRNLLTDVAKCRRIRSDYPHAIIRWHRPDGDVLMQDYLGCTEANDLSTTQFVRRLRAFEAAIDSVAGAPRWATRHTG